MKTSEVEKLYSQFILPSVSRVSLCLVKGKGSRVWDLEGKEYVDFFPGWGVSALGHCHPAVGYAVKNQLRKILHISNNYYNIKQVELAKEISRSAFPSRSFFCNSGAEAIEAAIKFVRRFGEKSGRYEIITVKRSFHGRTFGALSATGQEKIRDGFGPPLPGFSYGEFNDLESIERLLTQKTVAVLVEPVQGEGGIHVASLKFLRGLRELCDRKNLLLVLDEVQTGLGRTGKMFAFEHYGMEPDLMTLAKALGGGVAIGALVVHNKIQEEVFTAGTHASTYGGSPLVCAAALAVLKTIQRERLLQKVERLGSYLGERLKEFQLEFSVVREVRGIGLMLGIELDRPGRPYVERARERGLLINCTQEKVLRLMPALTISKALVDKGLRILEQVFKELG